MSWSPEDDEPQQQRRPSYRNSNSLCPCEMCSDQGPEATELDIEDYQ